MKVMQKVHDTPMAGHHDEKTTRQLLGKTFYWPKMKEVEHYVHTCVSAKAPSWYIRKSLSYIGNS
jgi:hypothetical protein